MFQSELKSRLDDIAISNRYKRASKVLLGAFFWASLFGSTLGLAEENRDDTITERIQADISIAQENSTQKFAREMAKSLVEKKAEVEIEKEKPVPDQSDNAKVKFFVKKIILEGNSVIASDKFAPILEAAEGRNTSFQELQAVAELITEYYRASGYLTSRAFVPTQKIAKNAVDQTVVIQILEGRVGEIHVSGNRYFKPKTYASALQLPKNSVFNMEKFQANLIALNQKDDRSAKAFIAKGAEPGTSDIFLKAEDHFPLHAAYEFNNYGTSLTRYARHKVSLSDNNLLGFGDSLDLGVTLAEARALASWYAQYSFPIEATGTVISLGANYAVTHLMRFDGINAKQYSVNAGLQQLFYRSLRFALSGFIGFEYKDSRSAFYKEKISLDQNRAIYFGPRLTVNDSWGRTFVDIDFHMGIPNFMGGSTGIDENSSRVRSGGRFDYFTGSITRVFRLPLDQTLLLKTSGQYSPSPLNSLEQFRAGGAFSVRGYPEGDSTGDSGYLWSAELRVPPYFIPKDWKIPRTKDSTWRNAISFLSFFEGGQAFNYKKQNAFSEKTRTLIGTGCGVRFYLNENAHVELDYGIPVGNASTDKDRSRIHLSVKIGL